MSLKNTFLFCVFFISVAAMDNPKIAIIGGGIGGTSCAYFLKKLFANNASITLFERDQIGGRLALIDIDGESYESGGSVIHPRNKYMKSFASLLGIKEKLAKDIRWGIFDGNEFVFEDSRWTLATLVKLLWRYGWDTFRLNKHVTSLLNDFQKIYTAQENGQAFTTVHNLLKHMNPLFPNMTEETIEASLSKKGFSENFIKELAQAVMLVNYGQTTKINSFVGFVSLAGSESGLWNLQDGNRQVPIGLLTKSGSRLIQADVTAIRLLENETYLVSYIPPLNDIPIQEEFNIVILASPLIRNAKNVRFENFKKDMTQFEGPYHRTISTFVVGKLKSDLFQTSILPDAILTNNDSFIFNSLGRSFPVSGIQGTSRRGVYKIFTKVPMTDKHLAELFDDIGTVKSKDWLAYPHYDVPEVIPSFVLHTGLYYLNAIEWSASAMEMSAIAGRNIALLSHNFWNKKLHLVDSTATFRKDEL